MKPANESGGYGIAHRQPGDRASELDERVAARSRPTPATGWPSRSSTLVDRADAVRRRHRAPPRRPAAVHPHRRARSYVTAGGLTRVALREGLARRELVAGRRQQGHLDRGGRSLRQPPGPPSLVMLLSRVAENLYWAARYLERAEDTARIVRELHRGDRRPARCRCRRRLGAAARRSPAAGRRSTPRHDQADEESHRAVPGGRRGQPRQRRVVRRRRRGRTCARRARCCPARRGRSVNDLYLYAEPPPPRRRRPPQPGAGSSSGSSADVAAHRRHPLGDDEPRRGVRVLAPRPGARAGRHDDPRARRAGRPRCMRAGAPTATEPTPRCSG